MNVSYSPAQYQQGVNAQQINSAQIPHFGSAPLRSIAAGSAAVILPTITKVFASTDSVREGAAAKASSLINNLNNSWTRCFYPGYMPDLSRFKSAGNPVINQVSASLDGVGTAIGLAGSAFSGMMFSTRAAHPSFKNMYLIPLLTSLPTFLGLKSFAGRSSLSSAAAPKAETFIKNVMDANNISPVVCRASGIPFDPAPYTQAGDMTRNIITTAVDGGVSLASFALAFFAGKWKGRIVRSGNSMRMS